jgi:hypothetical protein
VGAARWQSDGEYLPTGLFHKGNPGLEVLAAPRLFAAPLHLRIFGFHKFEKEKP